MKIIGLLAFFSIPAFAGSVFWAPANPPRARYRIEARVSADASRLDGSETISFTNNTSRPIGRVAFLFSGNELRVRVRGESANRIAGVKHEALFELPREVPPRAGVELAVEWVISHEALKDGEGGATWGWYPRLWWGFQTLDDYRLVVHAPSALTLLVAGRRPDTMVQAPDTRALGMFVGKGFQTASADVSGVLVTAAFKPKGAECAHLLLSTAVDAIRYYKEQFGLYPHNSLTIIPGGDTPVGGYPVATAIVAIHGQERMKEKPDDWWRWITAHEIGHMYWSEHVLAQGPDSLNWLMIGLGIHADQKYRRARGIKDAGELWKNYVQGVQKGYDTTMDLTEQQQDAVQWDLNNIVIHGKSSALMNALESAIGTKTFDAVYRRCLVEYAGKRLGWRDFQRVAEQESGQDLDWFFEQWVRSPAYADYKAADQACSNGSCTARVEKRGTMYMPVTVAARFEDGTEQRAVTERLSDEEIVGFRSKSPLKAVVLEPDAAVVLAETPSPAQHKLLDRIEALPWSDESLDLYQQANAAKLTDEDAWVKLAMVLYDRQHYSEALSAFAVVGSSGQPGLRFMGLVWQGHVLDLIGKRPQAVEKYEAALKVAGTPQMRHDQYQITIDRKWVEERLKTPFTR